MSQTVYERAKALTNDIQAAKVDKAKLEGQLEQVMGRLKTKFNLDTVADAKDRIDDLNTEIEEINNSVQSLSKELDAIERPG